MNNSLKDEIDNEIKSSETSRRKLILAAVVSAVIVVSTGIVWVLSTSIPEQIRSDESRSTERDAEQDVQQPDQNVVENIDSNNESTTTATAPVEPPKTNESIPYTPPARSIDRNKFIADGTTIMQNYNKIVGLLTFTSSMLDDEKASRIQQAQNLDKQYSNQVTSLRGNVLGANISSGPYMDAVELAENGVSNISVGLIFMGYWVSDRSRSADLQIGLGSVGEGSQILLEFSSSLNGL